MLCAVPCAGAGAAVPPELDYDPLPLQDEAILHSAAFVEVCRHSAVEVRDGAREPGVGSQGQGQLIQVAVEQFQA